jgi:hypothetical protein
MNGSSVRLLSRVHFLESATKARSAGRTKAVPLPESGFRVVGSSASPPNTSADIPRGKKGQCQGQIKRRESWRCQVAFVPPAPSTMVHASRRTGYHPAIVVDGRRPIGSSRTAADSLLRRPVLEEEATARIQWNYMRQGFNLQSLPSPSRTFGDRTLLSRNV